MSEIARFSTVGPEADVAISPTAQFEAFFEAEKDQLYRALCLVTRNRHEAEDLTQETFVRVLERWDRVAGVKDPHGYLYRTAMNAFRRRYGRAVRTARHSMRLVPTDDEIAEIDERDAAVRALAGLSPRQRAAVVLIDLLGFRFEEAARMLGIRASTLRVHASRAHSVLKETMPRE